jgi:hypothetical protein
LARADFERQPRRIDARLRIVFAGKRLPLAA